MASRSVRDVARALIGMLGPRLVPPRPTQVCFASIPDFTDSALAIYSHLLRTRRRLRFVWLVHDRAVQSRIDGHLRDLRLRNGHTLEVKSWNHPATYLAYLRSRVVFHTHGAFSFTRPSAGRTVVSLWHGMPLKAIGALDVEGLWRDDVQGDVHLASSRFFRYVISSAFEVSPRSVLVCGLPRNDVLKGMVPPVTDRAEVAGRLGIDADAAILLWMPTHRRDRDGTVARSFLDDIAPARLAALLSACERGKCQLVVKLHPYDDTDAERRSLLAAHRSVTVLRSQEWARTAVDVADLLAAGDGLITDISSVLVDHLHTGRPTGVFGLEEAAYERDTVVPMAPLASSSAITWLRTAEEVEAFVGAVTRRSVLEVPSDDLAHWLNEDHDVCASEHIAQNVGL